MGFPMISSFWAALITLLAVGFLRVARYRGEFYYLHRALKAPPFDVWFGTLLAIAELYKSSPADTHPHATMTLLLREHNLGPLYFLDNWPAAPERQMVINDPELAYQAVQKESLSKHWLYPRFIGHIVGKTSLVLSDGAFWKRTRAIFNPGFSAAHLTTLVPSIIDDVLIYHRALGKLAESRNLASLENLLENLMIDIMGHIVLDHDLNSQCGDNELVAAFRQAVKWTPHPVMTHPIFSLNPVRAFAHWYYARLMNNYIKRVIQYRLETRSSSIEQRGIQQRPGIRPVIDLAVDEYLTQSKVQDKNNEVDEVFQQLAIDQMKTFLFAGSDTSSSTICYVYYLLSLHPEALRKTRQEHDNVFGTRIGTAELLKTTTHLLHEIPYTTAVIKETLRLFPPASTTRAGNADFSVTHHGTAYPTKDMMVWVNLHTIHRRPDLFPSPDEFIPERFLPVPDNWQEVPKHAYRPFEKGPRACIGQELAMLEMKIVIALTLRDYDISAEYEQWDRSLGREKPGETLDGRRGMFGYRAYQVMKATAKPADGMPVRVRRRKE